MNEEYSSGVLEYKYFTSNFQSGLGRKKNQGTISVEILLRP